MRKKKINLIYLIADAGFSGGPIQLVNLIEGLEKSQYSITVISPQGYLSEKMKSLGIKWIEFPFARKPLSQRVLKKIIKKELTGRDIIHAHGVVAGRFAKRINRLLKQTLIYTEHNWTKDYRLPQNWRAPIQLMQLRTLSKYTTHTVCVSKAVQDFLISKKVTTKEKSSVIYNGVKFKEIKRREKKDPLILGTIASLQKRKGIVYLLEAFARFQEIEKESVQLKIIGAGPEEPFLKQHAVELGINFNIQWLGQNENLEEFWESINIYVQPSLDESFGMAVAEAMGYKIPVIATNVGALPEILGQAGLLVEPKNADQLVRAIQNVAHNQTIREENIQEAYEYAKKNFTIARMVEQYYDLYMRMGGLK